MKTKNKIENKCDPHDLNGPRSLNMLWFRLQRFRSSVCVRSDHLAANVVL